MGLIFLFIEDKRYQSSITMETDIIDKMATKFANIVFFFVILYAEMYDKCKFSARVMNEVPLAVSYQ